MRSFHVIFPVFIGAFLASFPAIAQLQLPSLIGDHMVFQSGKPAVVWGKDKPGQKVALSMAGNLSTTKADSRGNWKASLPALPPGGPYELSIDGSNSVTIHDVLVGEVWLGSGQSNMEFRMDQLRDPEAAIAQASDPKIRLFLQKLAMSTKPLDQPAGEWKVCSPQSVRDFSAVAYYFGRNLRQKLKVPVGLIVSSWGGSYAESWTPEKTLKSDPAFKPIWKRWNKIRPSERKGWLKGRFPVDFSVRNIRWIPKDSSQASLPVEARAVSTAPADAQKPGIWGTSVKVGSDISLSLSAKVPRMTGSFLTDAWGFMTTHLGPESKPLDLSSYDAVEFDAKGDGKYILFLSQPSVTDWDNHRTPDPFPVSKEWKHYRVEFSSLKQSGWGKPQPFTPNAVSNLSFGVDPKPLIEIPAALYNGMIKPFTPFPIKGVIWYQGEANTVHAGEYAKLLESMIGSWRKAWKDPQLSFLLAQLPNFIPGPGQGGGQWGELRDQQRKVAELTNNSMAVLIDLGEAHDIHPKDKADVGARLAQAALATTYGQKDAFLSPVFENAEAEGNKIRIHFKNAEEGLETKGGNLKGFEVAGADGKFVPAQGRIEKGTVLVWNDQVAEPKAVRYAWADDPIFNLYGKNGLPASPFKSDVSSKK
jgi:sialate O-acetylesterase